MTNLDPYNDDLEGAITLAASFHAGQKDKAGEPFIKHIMRVGTNSGPDTDAMIVGYLHDIVEDTRVTLEMLRGLGFNPLIVDAVDAMTYRTGQETYFQYIDRLIQNPLAAHVKAVDLRDNLDPSRQNFEGAESLQRRHRRALEIVMNTLLEKENTSAVEPSENQSDLAA